jgi:hypothetical protein
MQYWAHHRCALFVCAPNTRGLGIETLNARKEALSMHPRQQMSRLLRAHLAPLQLLMRRTRLSTLCVLCQPLRSLSAPGPPARRAQTQNAFSSVVGSNSFGRAACSHPRASALHSHLEWLDAQKMGMLAPFLQHRHIRSMWPYQMQNAHK